ncbi:MAG: glutathione S-transferase N-terminal domain-containing protein [Pseudomonadaceae bacterium]|nr:glutathione S-transferase N-terminal domain-containing protein [Pseudomonadaceae bacterium]
MQADKPYLHHGTMFSYYSAKTRAYLSYKHIAFVETYDSRDLSQRIAATTHKVMIPVVETPGGEILQDTTAIIDQLETAHPARPVFPEDPVLMLVTRIIEFIMDELWVTTAMHSRWNDPRSKAFVISEFGRHIGGSAGLRGEAAMQMGEKVAAQMMSYLPRLGISEAPGQAMVENLFKKTSRLLNQAVGPTQYAFGSRPSLIDFCLFTGYYAHHYRDHGDAMDFLKSQTPDLCYYLDNLHAACSASAEGDLALSDAFITYLEAIGPVGAEFAQHTLKNAAEVVAELTPGDVCNGALGPFTLHFEDGELQRGSSTFSAWKAQRINEVYAAMEDKDQRRAQALAERIGWLAFLQQPATFKLYRDDYQIKYG